MKLPVVFFVFIIFCGCQRDPLVVPPNVEKLVGIWELREPLPPYPVHLQLVLDTDNPPRDVTPFLVSGTIAGSRYEGRSSAALDGLMVVTALTDLLPTTGSDPFRQMYLSSLRTVVQFSYTTDNQLRLSHGSSQPGVLVYERR